MVWIISEAWIVWWKASPLKMSLLLGVTALVVMALWGARPHAQDLKVGDKAPGFALPDQNDRVIRLRDFLGKKTVVLAFYIKAFTPGWKKELLAYQADIAKFEQAGAEVIGISVDSRATNTAFAKDLGVKFPILSDESKAVSRDYGVLMPLIRLAKRTTFVIDRQGIIRHIERGGDAIGTEGAQQACSLAGRP
jgi:thioredoxin-dependent peroxiredoxin